MVATQVLNFEDEKVLITALLKNDELAFRYLVKTMYSSLLIVARAIAGSSIADEVVQESWISVLGALPKFEGRSTLKTWITRIVANEAKRRKKKESRLVSLDTLTSEEDSFLERFDSKGHWGAPPVSWDIASPDEILEEKQLKRCIDATVKVLPEKQKAVFLLRDIENYSLQQICNILEVSDSNVRVLLFRARNRLYQTIEHFQETGEC
ncbi:MAG: RNA polymerase subunit sigma [Gammaproteobacteria bacterium]|nr:MAG: RNA polymerase subunit sigma [Gammaproteobacteria bacterium]